MTIDFEVLDYRPTDLGDLLLRRRVEASLGTTVWEVKLGEEFLMTSLFTAGERAVANLGLGAVEADDALDVIVGGLGLGYTAREALRDDRVRSLTVIEYLPEVIRWHRDGLVPLGAELFGDSRFDVVHADFFAAADTGFSAVSPSLPAATDAILLDIDHEPGFWLHQRHGGFYTQGSLAQLADQLRPGGVFALWSDEQEPDSGFVELLDSVFETAEAHTVAFANHYTGGESTSTIYVGITAI